MRIHIEADTSSFDREMAKLLAVFDDTSDAIAEWERWLKMPVDLPPRYPTIP